jgi:hypothetical protein
MIYIKNTLPLFLCFFLLFSCITDEPTPDNSLTKEELLTRQPWRVSRYSKPDNSVIADNQLSIQAVVIRGLQFEFKLDGRVFGIDRVTKQVINQGIWRFLADNKTLDIQVTGFSGEFALRSLTRDGLILATSTDGFVTGIGDTILLEFIPVL